MSRRSVLVISYLFAPSNEIGAVRPTKIAKYLARKGFEVSVICADGKCIEDNNMKADMQHLKKITRIGHSSFYHQLMKCRSRILERPQHSGNNPDMPSGIMQKSKFKKWLSVMIRQSFDMVAAYDFYFRSKKVLRNMDMNQFNYMFSTFGPLGSHLVGKYVRHRNKQIRWIADFRDPMDITTVHVYEKEHEQYGFDRTYQMIQAGICRDCDYITAVSKGFLDQVTKGELRSKASVVTNGYDTDDFKDINNIVNSSTNPNKLTFIYTGALYEGKRDVSPIFRAINELKQEGKVDLDRIQFYYAGKEEKHLIYQAKKNNCEKIVKLFGYVSRKKSLELQNQAHILVVVTWNEPGYKGVLPGKFFEYMQFKKPIIAIISGRIKESEISEIVNDCQLGCWYENIQHEKRFMLLKEYIYHQYSCFVKDGTIEFNPLSACVDQYSYEKITDNIINIFKKIGQTTEHRG